MATKEHSRWGGQAKTGSQKQTRRGEIENDENFNLAVHEDAPEAPYRKRFPSALGSLLHSFPHDLSLFLAICVSFLWFALSYSRPGSGKEQDSKCFSMQTLS